jgi:hypothetical protein
MPSKSQPWPERSSYADRWRVARRVAVRWRPRLLQYRNVIAVGVGLEHTGLRTETGGSGSFQRIEIAGGKTKEENLVPCIHVVVRRKWKDKRRRKDSLPDSISTYMVVKGKRKRVNVPVDIIARIKSGLHLAYPRQYVASEIQLGSIRGTATAFVRFRKQQRQFLLSCHHVLGLTELAALPPNGLLPHITVDYTAMATGLLGWLPLNPDACDAALASCSPVQPQLSFLRNGNTIRLQGVLDRNDPVPSDVLILTSSGIRPAQTVAVGPHSELYYGKTRELVFENVLHSTVTTGSGCFPGDSGAAVVTEEGRLVAMHYAGALNGGIDSYAIMAYDIFEAFKSPLILWP